MSEAPLISPAASLSHAIPEAVLALREVRPIR